MSQQGLRADDAPAEEQAAAGPLKRAVLLFHVRLNLTAVWKSCRHQRSIDVRFFSVSLCPVCLSVNNFLHSTNLISPNARVSSFHVAYLLRAISYCSSSIFRDFVDLVTRRRLTECSSRMSGIL